MAGAFAAKLVHHFQLMLAKKNINTDHTRVFDNMLQVSNHGSTEAISQDPEAKTEELNQNIRLSEVNI